MKLIYDEFIMKIAPRLLKENRKDILIVLEKLIHKYLVDNIKYLVLLDRIDELSERELDLVQDELHVDFYNYKMTLEQKRKACKESLIVHSAKGTPGSVSKVLEVFFKGAKLEEWFQYDGRPGYFRILIEGDSPSNLEEVFRKVESTKKKSQHLEKISFLSKSEIIMNTFSHKRNATKQKHFQSKASFAFENIKLNNNNGNRQQVMQRR